MKVRYNLGQPSAHRKRNIDQAATQTDGIFFSELLMPISFDGGAEVCYIALSVCVVCVAGLCLYRY